ncbi:hypothetical protein [Anabaena azotica]|uniref:CRISPR-associated protein n=1 Tax=Anabaena azotica FACHB-119 TaxID=947527 RepID=A0ABR8D6W7_9NOST|nr:hypothetical protein [Anabaena azotica]MBD2501982.1 hypothetical protein [Anabaena azotica FACHB-119]
MNIWIVSIGNSDVQLKTRDNWNNLYRQVRSQLNDRNFQPVQVEEEESFTVPARVMGIVYGQNLDDKFYTDLHFPILDALSKKLTGKLLPDKIIVILSNQESVFTAQDKRLKKCPYWQDTCKLQPILAKYFQINFTRLQAENIQFIELNPESKNEGLDNWDQALGLVRERLSQLTFKPEDKIYVSHQAGTPAISSAVQFVSIAKFGKQVRFLVTNEYEQERTDIIASSKYLKGIQLQEAKMLLKRFDYSGVERLLSSYWENNNLSPEEEKLQRSLKIAIQWNFANFDNFAQELGDNAQERLQHWWWTGYEAAYLAVVRLEQGNTVEALFHSFRAVESLICKWAEYNFPKHIEYEKQGKYKNAKSPKLKKTILNEYPNYLSTGKKPRKSMLNQLNNDGMIGLYSEALYQLIQTVKPECQDETHVMNVVWGEARDYRNVLFHQMLGLQESELFEAWGTNKKDNWKKKLLNCLNFISGQTIFTSIPKASLMFQVHQDLMKALDDYEGKIYENTKE